MLINAQVAFISGNDTICENANPAVVKIDFLSTNPPYTFEYVINGISQNSITTQNTPYLIKTKQEGVYTLKSFNDAFSVGQTNGSALVTVRQPPIAIIHLLTDTLSVFFPKTKFVSKSIGDIVQQVWNFGDNTGNFTINNPEHIFPTDANGMGIVAQYQAVLIVEDENSCFDTTVHQIWVQEEYCLFIPTSFTPDNDKINDKFCVEYHAIRENTFLFKVYNVQGDLMFQSNNPQELKCSMHGGWDGIHYKTQKELPSDTYVYELYFQDFEGWKHKEYGTIVLVR